jgi:hypothetical protein
MEGVGLLPEPLGPFQSLLPRGCESPMAQQSGAQTPASHLQRTSILTVSPVVLST